MTLRAASDLSLSEVIAETGDPSLSMASGGLLTITETLALMGLEPGQRYVEVGCAAGWMCNRVADRHRGLHVFGVDPQPAAIATARATATEWQLPNAVYIEGDARDLPLPPRSFSGVFAGNIAVFVPAQDRPAMIDECLRILAPGGSIVAVPMYYPDDLPDPEVLTDVELAIGAPIHRGTEEEWIALYESRGLHLIDRIPHRFAKYSDDALVAYVDHVMASHANDHHSRDRRADLGARLLELHRLFAQNNQHLGYSLLKFQPHQRDSGPFLLEPAAANGSQPLQAPALGRASGASA